MISVRVINEDLQFAQNTVFKVIDIFFFIAEYGSFRADMRLERKKSDIAQTGMIAFFCGVTNCPITSILIAFELFGFEGVSYYLVAVAVSYATSGYYGLYKDQTIVYSKYKAKYVNQKTRT